MTIIFYREKDKENKIKLNKNNIVGYLKEQDLWENNNIKIKEEKFMNNLSKIKSFNIKIKEILWLYYYLTDKKEEDFDSDIKEKYKKYLENLKKRRKKKLIKKIMIKKNQMKRIIKIKMFQKVVQKVLQKVVQKVNQEIVQKVVLGKVQEKVLKIIKVYNNSILIILIN